MTENDCTNDYKYVAFISYSHRDRATVDWLHKSLESYSVPRELVGLPGRDGPIPKQLFPIFRDREELSTSSDLSTTICEALDRSANLIVVGSKASAKSRWVNEEVLHFKRLDRAGRIHALILDGEPNAADPEQECFPKALRFKLDATGRGLTSLPEEQIAGDLRPEGDGKENSKLKLIAGVLGISYNSLRQREVVAARRRRRIFQGIAGAIAVLALGAGVAVWRSLYFERQSEERQIPGLRVEQHRTTLDLSGWAPTTQAEIDGRVKRSSALSTDEYVVVKTQEYARNYVHIEGTTSGIAPDIKCDACRVEPRVADRASRTPNEFRIIFDISELGLKQRATLKYRTTYWNAFQSPDQWWAGFRVLYQTEKTRFEIIFPAGKHASREGVNFYYHDTKDHPFIDEPKVSFDTDEAGLVAKLTWYVDSPSTDRSYRVRWNWDGIAGND